MHAISKRARAFCVFAVGGQWEKRGNPRWLHPIAVANILMDHGIDDTRILSVAYLHDVLYDTETTESLLRSNFDSEICDMVLGLNIEGVALGHGGGYTRLRILLGAAINISDSSAMVKIADRLHHMKYDNFRNGYAEESLGLLEVLKPVVPKSLAEEFTRVAVAVMGTE